MITWAEKIAFVGMTVETVSSSDSLYQHHVKVRIPDGVCSYGDGHTMEEAIKSAAVGMPIDWWSVERKITEKAWGQISHL